MNYDEKQNAVKSSTSQVVSSVFESVVCLSSLGLEAGVAAAVARRGYLLTGSQVSCATAGKRFLSLRVGAKLGEFVIS